MSDMNEQRYPTQPDKNEEIELKIRAHRQQRKKRILMVLIIVAAAIAALITYRKLRTFTDYRVLETIERSDTEATRFTSFNGYIIKYSNDGATMTDTSNKTIWTQSFNMQDPIVVKGDKYIAFGDRNKKTIYIMDEDGYQAKISTDMPITKMAIADQGNVAVLMQDSNVCYLGLYSMNGKKLAEGSFHFESGGYPLDVAISPDGEKLAVPVINLSSGSGDTMINFYDFSDSSSGEEDNLTASYNCKSTTVPKVIYTSSNKLIAFGSDKIFIFSGDTSKLTKTVKLERRVKSIFYNEDTFGLLFVQTNDNEGNTVQLYNMNGRKIREFALKNNYAKAGFMDNGEMYFTNNTNFAICRRSGREKFRGTADTAIYSVMSTGRFRKYVVIREGKTEYIRLKTF